MFSPASVAKSYLEELQIVHPSEKVKNADRNEGICMQAYFGGRAECHIRNWEVPTCTVDFMSQYTTVNELLDNWSVLTADRVEFREAKPKLFRHLYHKSHLIVVLIASSGRASNYSPSFTQTMTLFPFVPCTTVQPKTSGSTISQAKNPSRLPDLTSLHPFC